MAEGWVTACQSCGHGKLPIILDMGPQPLAERMGSRKLYPLVVLQCQACSLVQLGYVAPQRELFPEDHPYTTGSSSALVHHYQELAAEIDHVTVSHDLVVDIGANDGTLLAQLPPSLQRLGVEPTGQVRKCQEKGLLATQAFWTQELARIILKEHGHAQVITACNVLAHCPDVHDFLEGVRELLDGSGVFITENHDLISVVDGLQFDTIYHEHLRYYSVASLSYLLSRHGLEVQGLQYVPTHGGSFRLYARKQRTDFARRADQAAGKLAALLKDLHERGEVIYGVGAATRATPLIHYAGIAEFIEVICEAETSEKIGGTMPGTSIEVVPDSRLITDQPGYALLFAWHLSHVILPRLGRAGYKGKFIIPLPEPRIVSHG